VLIDVDPTGPVPVYEQVRSQLAEMIRTGALPAGFRLAPIRQLAADLALAPGTVARVYRELEADGLVVSRVRHGTVVAELSRQARTDTQQVLADSARTYAAVAARLGLTLEDALGVVRDQWSVAGQGSVAPDGP
jgi:DNA-binding transcriptional regulator YhcF (GntR family)